MFLCYEYLDKSDCGKVVKGAKTNTLAKGQQEQEPSNISNYMLEDVVNLGKGSGAVKGHGKGKGNHGGPERRG